jgi:predicted dehydrogenase
MKGSLLQQRSDLQEQLLQADAVPSLESWCPPPAQPDGILHTEVEGVEIQQQLTSTPGNYMGYYDDLYKALTGQAKNPVPPEDGIKTIRIIEAVFRSVAEKKLIVP